MGLDWKNSPRRKEFTEHLFMTDLDLKSLTEKKVEMAIKDLITPKKQESTP